MTVFPRKLMMKSAISTLVIIRRRAYEATLLIHRMSLARYALILALRPLNKKLLARTLFPTQTLFWTNKGLTPGSGQCGQRHRRLTNHNPHTLNQQSCLRHLKILSLPTLTPWVRAGQEPPSPGMKYLLEHPRKISPKTHGAR